MRYVEANYRHHSLFLQVPGAVEVPLRRQGKASRPVCRQSRQESHDRPARFRPPRGMCDRNVERLCGRHDLRNGHEIRFGGQIGGEILVEIGRIDVQVARGDGLFDVAILLIGWL